MTPSVMTAPVGFPVSFICRYYGFEALDITVLGSTHEACYDEQTSCSKTKICYAIVKSYPRFVRCMYSKRCGEIVGVLVAEISSGLHDYNREKSWELLSLVSWMCRSCLRMRLRSSTIVLRVDVNVMCLLHMSEVILVNSICHSVCLNKKEVYPGNKFDLQNDKLFNFKP